MKACRKELITSHLMFPYDLILFGRDMKKQMDFKMEILNYFCHMSFPRINADKSKIVFSKNTTWNIQRKLTQSTGFKETNELGKYLGVPLTGKGPKGNEFQYLIDQVKHKLVAKKGKIVSFA